MFFLFLPSPPTLSGFIFYICYKIVVKAGKSYCRTWNILGLGINSVTIFCQAAPQWERLLFCSRGFFNVSFHSGLSLFAPFREKCKVTETFFRCQTGSLISQIYFGCLIWPYLCCFILLFSFRSVRHKLILFCKELSVRAQALARSLDK